MMNPILASSARRRMRSLRTPIIITLYGLVLLAFAIFYLRNLNGNTLLVRNMRAGTECYISLVVLQFFLTILVAPAMTAGSIAGERERQTLDLLLVTNTGSFRITWGKLMESFGFMALLIFSSLPMLAMVLMTGGITLAQIATSLLYILLTAFAAQCVGLFTSALFKRTVVATVAAYLLILAIGVGTLIAAVYMGRSVLYMDYDSIMAIADSNVMRYFAWILYGNPAVGLLSLVAEQTMILESTLRSLLGYTMSYALVQRLDYSQIIWGCMAVMAVGGLILTFLAAILVRSRQPKMRRKRKKA